MSVRVSVCVHARVRVRACVCVIFHDIHAITYFVLRHIINL